MTEITRYDEGHLGPLPAGWDLAVGTSDWTTNRRGGLPFHEGAGTADRPSRTIFEVEVGPGMQTRHWSRTRTEPSRLGFGLSPSGGTEDEQDELSILQILAEAGRAEDFARVAEQIPWEQRSAADLARIVRLALTAGAHLLARDLAARGAQRYPDHAELRKMARILAPPRVVRRDVPPDHSWAANRAWLVAHGEAYRGQWLALKGGELLAAAPAVREVRTAVDQAAGVLILKVP